MREKGKLLSGSPEVASTKRWKSEGSSRPSLRDGLL